MRVLVCGSRHFTDGERLFDVLDNLNSETTITGIVEGGARGADNLGSKWADSRRIERIRFSADWERYGKGAGPIRNKQMLDEGKPDLVVAFMFKDSRGTKNMVEQAEKAGVPTKVIHCE